MSAMFQQHCFIQALLSGFHAEAARVSKTEHFQSQQKKCASWVQVVLHQVAKMVLVHIISCKSSLLKKFFPIFRNLCETRKNFYCCCIFQRQCFPKMTWRQVRGYLKNMKRRQYEKREFQLLSCLSEIMFPYHTQLKELSGIIGPSTIHECMGRHFGTSTVSRTSVSL